MYTPVHMHTKLNKLTNNYTARTHTQTHSQKYIYIYIYIYIYVCVCDNSNPEQIFETIHDTRYKYEEEMS